MSFFDPQHLYGYGKRSTKKGQIIQKKIIKRKGPLSEKDKKYAIDIINSFGYRIIPKNQPIPPNQTTYFDQMYIQKSINLEIPENQTRVDVTINDIITSIGDSINSLLIYKDKAINSHIICQITSVEYYIVTSNNNVNARLEINKVDWSNTINTSTGVVAIPLSKNNFRFITYRLNSYGNRATKSFDTTSDYMYLGETYDNSLDNYKQLCDNHQLENPYSILVFSTSSGNINTLNIGIIFAVEVQYNDIIHPIV